MGTLRVVVAEDHALMRDAIRVLLGQTDDIEIVAEAKSGDVVLPLVARLLPDLVLLDMALPRMDGLTCLQLIRERHPRVKVVMLSALDEPDQIAGALGRGASGYIVKGIHPADLASAIRQAVEGSFFAIAPNAASRADGESEASGLSKKELVVLREIALGRANREIAAELWISEQTVKFHVRNIYRKLGISNRTEALRCAYRLRLVETSLTEPA